MNFTANRVSALVVPLLLFVLSCSKCGGAEPTPAAAMPEGTGIILRARTWMPLHDLIGRVGLSGIDADLARFDAFLRTLPDTLAASGRPCAAFVVNAGPEGLRLGLALSTPSLPDATPAESYSFQGHTVYRYTLDTLGDVYAAHHQNLLLLSGFPLPVEDMLGRLGRGGDWWPESLSPLYGEVPDTTQLELYLHLPDLPALLAPITTRQGQERLMAWGRQLAWIKWGVAVRDSALLLTGGAVGAPPGNWALTSWPGRTFWQRVTPAGFPALVYQPVRPAAMMQRQQDPTPAEQALARWLPDDALYLRTPAGESIVLLQPRDSAAAARALDELLRETGVLRREPYLLTELVQVASPGTFAALLGPEAFGLAPWLARTDSLVAVSSSRAALESWLDAYTLGASLGESPEFVRLYRQLPAAAEGGNGALLYWTPEVQAYWISTLFTQWRPELPYALHLHRLHLGDHHYEWTGLGLRKDSARTAATGSTVAWRYTLPRGARTVQPVRGLTPAATGEAAVQDSSLTLHVLDGEGRPRWKGTLDGELLSAVYRLTGPAREPIYLFNTNRSLYGLDGNGQLLPGYPRPLPAAASTGMTVVDFNHDGTFAYFIPLRDGRIAGYDQLGEPLPGWNPRAETGYLGHPLLHFQDPLADYLVALDTAGRIRAYARDGSVRWAVDSLDTRFVSPLYGQYLARQGGRLVAAGRGGRLRVLNFRGEHFPLQIQAGERAPQNFLFVDLGGDERADYLAQAGNTVSLYGYTANDRFTRRWSMELPAPVDTLFTLPGLPLAGGLNRRRGVLYLFDAQGKLTAGSPLAGKLIPALLRMEGGRDLLISAYDNTVYAFAWSDR